MGDPATFYRGDRWNPDGYFEQRDVLRLNKLLVHGRWWKFAYFRLPSRQAIMSRGRLRASLISALAQKYKDALLKENRFSLTLPAWQAHGAQVDRIIICLRHPLAVAASLNRRNHIPLSLGLRLWREHNERILESLGGLPVWYVNYDELLEAECATMEVHRLFQFLGLDLTRCEQERITSAIIRSAYNHFPKPSSDPSDAAGDLWRCLLQRHREQGRQSSNCAAFG